MLYMFVRFDTTEYLKMSLFLSHIYIYSRVMWVYLTIVSGHKYGVRHAKI